MPSDNVYQLVKNDKIGIWVESFDKGKSSAIIIKSSSSSIKSVMQGCDLKLLVGICSKNKKKYIAIGAMIYDVHDSPLLIFYPARYESSIDAVRFLMTTTEITLSFFDELDLPVFSAKGQIDIFSESFITGIDQNVTIPEDMEVVDSMVDSFALEVDSQYGTSYGYKGSEQKYNCSIERRDIAISESTPILVNTFSEDIPKNIVSYDLSIGNEGTTQELQLDFILNHHFDGKSFLSPQIRIGAKIRELTDILFVRSNNIYLIESKSLNINLSGVASTLSRRAGKIKKHANRALGQMEGVFKKIRQGYSVMENETLKDISIPKKNKLHGIILLSNFHDYYIYEDWVDCSEKIYKISSDINNCTVHLMDLTELVNLLKLSHISKIKFDEAMAMRFEGFRETGILKHEHINSSLPF